MAKKTANAKAKNNNGVNLGIENELWEAADKLRGHLDAAEYKSVVLGLIFLKYVSDMFEQVHARVEKEAVEVNDSAVKVLGDDALKAIACELVETVRNNTTIDWTVRETVRAKLRVMVKRILRKYGYPPDKQERATNTVIGQAEVIARDWAG
jgi:hypothetical protein